MWRPHPLRGRTIFPFTKRRKLLYCQRQMHSESKDFTDLIARCRNRCLWFLRPDAMPSGRQAQLRVLDYVERYGNHDDFIAARRLRQWLSQHSSEAFAVSSPPAE